MLLEWLNQFQFQLIHLKRQSFEAQLVEAVRANFDLRPAGIIKMLDLKHPIYKQTAAYGHFGRTDVLLPWEKLDKVNVLKDAVQA